MVPTPPVSHQPTSETAVSDTAPTLDIRLAAELTVIRPGDTVLVRLATPNVTQQQAHHIKQRLEDSLQGVTVRLVTGVDDIHVYRPADASTPTNTPEP